ncbi:MAG: DUF4349 domain-containing protein [Actinomycetota bacterium]|nr:DUF4349 domain-containing protein [Actinomycetota bacterium]
MRLSDQSKTRVPEAVRAELDAVDRAIAGGQATPGMEELELLTHELRAMRPDEDADFAAALDAWAAAGFPRDARPGLASPDPGGSRLGARLASLRPRRLAPIAAVMAGAVIAAVAVTQVREVGGGPGGGPVAEVATEGADQATAPAAGEKAATELRRESAELDPVAGRQYDAVTGRLGLLNDGGKGPLRGVDARKVERDASLTLTAPGDEVQDVTNEAIATVRGHGGVVLSSNSTSSGDSAQATLQLVVPSAKLDAAISDLSGLADVKALSEASEDITRPFVKTKDVVADLRAERRGVRSALEAATTQDEIDQLKARLEGLQGAIARAESEFEQVQKRARLSDLTLQITSEGASEGDWSFSDALDDAGKVLTVAAGVALISAAVLVPLALIAAIAFMLVSWANRRSRERALDAD